MAGTIPVGELRKGVKIQIDGDPFLVTECNFVKPGKGQAMYKCRVKNLIKGSTLDRTWKSGDSVETADIEEIQAQFLYKQGDKYVFMDQVSFEQHEIHADNLDDSFKFVKEEMICDMTLFNGLPIVVSAPNHVVLKIEYCEPGAKGDTATKVTKTVKLETGAELICPSFVNMGEYVRIDTRTAEYIERVRQ